jgi:hypothetical protein
MTRTSHVPRLNSRKPGRAAPVEDTVVDPSVNHVEAPRNLAWTRTDAPRSYGRAVTEAYNTAPERLVVGRDDHETVLTDVTVRSALTTVLAGTLEATTARSRPLAVLTNGTSAWPVLPVRPEPTFSQVLEPATLRCNVTAAPGAATCGELTFIRSRTVTVATSLVPYAADETALIVAARPA